MQEKQDTEGMSQHYCPTAREQPCCKSVGHLGRLRNVSVSQNETFRTWQGPVSGMGLNVNASLS